MQMQLLVQITITFDIGADGSLQTINLLSALDDITDSVIIDGFSQYGALTPSSPLIEINGAGTSAANGFQLEPGSDGSTIQGLVINNFDLDGVLISNSNNHIPLSAVTSVLMRRVLQTLVMETGV